jgi:multiple sugar transport system permease protein
VSPASRALHEAPPHDESQHDEHRRDRPMSTARRSRAGRTLVLAVLAGILLAMWAFPVLWGLLTSFKSEGDVIAYPPKFLFSPTLANYREVIFGSASILPNLVSSVIIASVATLLTMLFATPASYALARLDLPRKRPTGFYVLATQMLPPVGLIIPYYLALQKAGALDTYAGIIAIDLSFSLPFAIWLMVSYFEDIPREMEEAALLDRAGRWRAFVHVILPQAAPGIAVTTIFVFLNAWNEFMFAVVLGGNRVRPVTVAMYNFISVEQTLWAKLAAAAMLAMAPVIVLGFFAQRHIVKGLTVGAVKGGGRR